jgi:hypothetical protein
MARKILARHGTENLGTEKYWHGTARKNVIKLIFLGKYFLVEKPVLAMEREARRKL